MTVARRSSFVEELRSGLARALEGLADAARGGQPAGDVDREIAELRERVEYLEDSLAAFDARAERDEKALRPWSEVRR